VCAVDIAVLKDGDEVTFGESKCVVRLTARTIADLNVGQLMRACVEAAAHRIEMRGLDNAKALLTEMCEAKAVLLSKVTSDEHETPLTSKQELEVSLAELCAAQHVLRFDPV